MKGNLLGFTSHANNLRCQFSENRKTNRVICTEFEGQTNKGWVYFVVLKYEFS